MLNSAFGCEQRTKRPREIDRRIPYRPGSGTARGVCCGVVVHVFLVDDVRVLLAQEHHLFHTLIGISNTLSDNDVRLANAKAKCS